MLSCIRTKQKKKSWVLILEDIFKDLIQTLVIEIEESKLSLCAICQNGIRSSFDWRNSGIRVWNTGNVIALFGNLWVQLGEDAIYPRAHSYTVLQLKPFTNVILVTSVSSLTSSLSPSPHAHASPRYPAQLLISTEPSKVSVTCLWGGSLLSLTHTHFRPGWGSFWEVGDIILESRT